MADKKMCVGKYMVNGLCAFTCLDEDALLTWSDAISICNTLIYGILSTLFGCASQLGQREGGSGTD